ncbi:Uncharacterized protein ChrSV_4730 [Chromobacterium vaccinii]|nr:Uncharacterized protein ChrSW_4730 [Chromobacterium vaccinii]QND92186.1 Uncharacterized protein ChrSV_4730 [Chromobacterium vaccinii]
MSAIIKRIVWLLFSCFALSACAGTGGQLGASMTVVNYSGKGYDWVAVAKPDAPEQAEAADMVSPYGASGIMCCVNLPAKWQPGMKLVVQFKDATKAKTAAEWSKENIPLQLRTVEVPRYAEGDVGTVWVQFLPDGKVELVVSRYDPSNVNWPGVMKGWPKPSMEYRRKIWSDDLKREKELLEVMQQAIQAPKVDERDKPAMQETINDIKIKIDKLERALK